MASTADNWKRVAFQEKRRRDSVVLDPGVLELVLNDARDFLNSKKWYSDRGACVPSSRAPDTRFLPQYAIQVSHSGEGTFSMVPLDLERHR